MPAHLQGIIALVIVAAAAFYLIKRMVGSAKGHSEAGCSKCSCGEGEKKA